MYVLGKNNTYVKVKKPTLASLKAEVITLKQDKVKLREDISQLNKQHEKQLTTILRAHTLEIQKKDAIIANKSERTVQAQKTRMGRQNMLDKTRWDLKRSLKKIRELKAQIKKPRKTAKELHLEIVFRTIIAYNKLTKDGILVFIEFVLLLMGSQKEFFSVEDIKTRFGYLRYIKRDMLLCIESGYIAKVYRKKLYYLTMNGKIRLNDILEYIYQEKGTGHPIKRV